MESLNYYRILQERGLTAAEAFEVVHARSRDDGRYPMAWDGTANAGFTLGVSWIGLPANHVYINAADEMADPNSVRAYTQRLIALRKAEPVIQTGDVRFLDSPSDKVIVYERTLGDERILVQCNFSGDEQPALPADGGAVLVCNWDDPAPDGSVLRPWEVIAHVWR